jgi:hypothetical protein
MLEASSRSLTLALPASGFRPQFSGRACLPWQNVPTHSPELGATHREPCEYTRSGRRWPRKDWIRPSLLGSGSWLVSAKPKCKVENTGHARFRCAVGPNTSFNRTRYGKRRKPGLRHMVHHLSPGLRRLPPRAG